MLDSYNLKCENIDELNSFDFTNLIQNLIEIDFPMKLIEETLKTFEIFGDEQQNKQKIYFAYLTKITLLFCSNIVGGSYIYTSNFIPKMLNILKQTNFNEFSEFVLEMISILKISFNRKIIDYSFMVIKNMENSMNLKEFLFYVLFRNDPVSLNDSFYYFKNFERKLKRIKSNYNFIFEKGNKIFTDSFKNIKFDESFLNIIKTIALNMKDEFVDFENQVNYQEIYVVLTDEEIFEKNEKKIDDIINKEIKNIKEKIPGFILIDILCCLENLNQTNFYLNFEEESFFRHEIRIKFSFNKRKFAFRNKKFDFEFFAQISAHFENRRKRKNFYAVDVHNAPRKRCRLLQNQRKIYYHFGIKGV